MVFYFKTGFSDDIFGILRFQKYSLTNKNSNINYYLTESTINKIKCIIYYNYQVSGEAVVIKYIPPLVQY